MLKKIKSWTLRNYFQQAINTLSLNVRTGTENDERSQILRRLHVASPVRTIM
jgi:hypothetical protein